MTHSSMYRQGQRGIALVVVMILLIMITLMGTIAVKSSLTGLKVATNSQINTLLLQNNDSALAQLENPRQVARQLAADGMFSFLDSPENATDQLVFCYRAAKTSLFTLRESSVIDQAGGTSKIGISGFCKQNDFSTGRSAILTQVYLNRINLASQPFDAAPVGTSLGQSGIPAIQNTIGVSVISVLPSFASASASQIEACFRKRTDVTDSVQQCFSNLQIPYNLQHADYTVGGQPTRVQ